MTNDYRQMTTDEHNLPADFDDLSKHAPLLEKIRAKGDGFVVPENYFADAGELSMVSGHLSVVSGRQSAAGFVVPENYFEELAERIIAVASLSSTTDRGPQVVGTAVTNGFRFLKSEPGSAGSAGSDLSNSASSRTYCKKGA